MKLRCLFVFIGCLAHAATAQGWHFGMFFKAGVNITSTNAENTGNGSMVQRAISPATGIYIGRTTTGRFGIHSTLLFSKAFYDINYTEENNTFLDAEIRFTQWSVNGEYCFNRNRDTRPFLFAGVQSLFRRYGTERFVNGVIPACYWPDFRLHLQTGIGLHWIQNKWSINPFFGVRINPGNSLVYDHRLNQFFAGIAIGFMAYEKSKNKYNKCPNNF